MEKRIRPALMRCLYFDTVTFGKSVWQYLLVIVFFVLFWRATNTVSPIFAAMLFSMGISMAYALQRYMLYYKQMVGFSLTRRSFLLGGLLVKPVYMLFCVALTLVGSLIDRAHPLGWMLLLAAMGGMLSASYGELAGAMILRWNRIGFVLYMVLFVSFFMVISGVWGRLLFQSMITELNYASVALTTSIVSLIASPLLHVFAWLLLRGTEVRS